MKRKYVQDEDQQQLRRSSLSPSTKARELALAVLLTEEELKNKFPDLDIGNGIRVFDNYPPRHSFLLSNSRKPTKTTAKAHLRTDPNRNTRPIHKVRPKLNRTLSTTSTSTTTNSYPVSYATSSSTSSPHHSSVSSSQKKSVSKTAVATKIGSKLRHQPSGTYQRRKTFPRIASVKASNNIAQVANSQLEVQNKEKDKDEDFKPGTVGSRQALNASKRRYQKKIDKPANDAIDSYHIDTGGYVEDSFIAFTAEVAERMQLEDLPRNPLRLCKPFRVMIPNCDLSNSNSPP